MSGESVLHARLVKMLIAKIEAEHVLPRGMIVLADHHSYGTDRPPRVGGYTPDVYASDVPVTTRIIGEAKTQNDLRTTRSQLQIRAFLDHLCLYPNSAFYLAVPWFVGAYARGLLAQLRDPAHASVAARVVALT